MTSCPRCSQWVDEKVHDACPNCSEALAPPRPIIPPLPNVVSSSPPESAGYTPPGSPAAPLSPNVRRTLNGEIIETPAPQSPYAPAPPPLSASAPPPTFTPYAYGAPAPAARPAGNYLLTGLLAVGGLFAVLLVGFFLLRAAITQQQAAYERGMRLDIATPQSAATEALRCLKEQTWNKFYCLCEFASPKTKTKYDAEAYARQFSRGLDSSPMPSSEFARLFGTMTDITAGTPRRNGNLADVPVSYTLHFQGRVLPEHGVAHLIQCEDKKWRLDLSSVNVRHEIADDQATYHRVFWDLMGVSDAMNAPYRSNLPAPPATIYPPRNVPWNGVPNSYSPSGPGAFRQNPNRFSPYGRSPYPPNVPMPPQPTQPAPANPAGQPTGSGPNAPANPPGSGTGTLDGSGGQTPTGGSGQPGSGPQSGGNPPDGGTPKPGGGGQTGGNPAPPPAPPGTGS